MTSDPANSVVHLTTRRGEAQLATGSGVLYERNGSVYIVTAWHNLAGRHSETLHPLHTQGGLPDNVVATIANRSFNETQTWGYIRRPVLIPLEDSERTFYLVHSQGWPRIDVAVIPIDPEQPNEALYSIASGEQFTLAMPLRSEAPGNGALGFDIECIQASEAGAKGFGIDFNAFLLPSDDLFILGYPQNIVDWTGQPLWKRATVASSPQLGWQREKMFLVDCASREGMSGAPAIYYSSGGHLHVGAKHFIAGQPTAIFHGIYVGRLGHTNAFEAQIGVVWQRSVIDEIIDGHQFAPHSNALVATQQEIHSAIQQAWPQQNDSYAEQLLDEKAMYILYFRHEVMKKINGRANPEDVKNEILEIAKAKIAT